VAAVGILCFSSFLFQPSVAMADIIYLKIPGIRGESTDRRREGEIEVRAFTSGVERVAAGSSTAKPQFSEIGVFKSVDISSPLLFVNCATGKIFEKATLTAVRSDDLHQPYLTITLWEVTITNVEVSGNSQLKDLKDARAELVMLSFAKIQWTVTEYDLITNQPKATKTGGYDLRSNTPF
jgi:type VI secretion system secreted protein Hcp